MYLYACKVQEQDTERQQLNKKSLEKEGIVFLPVLKSKFTAKLN